MIKTIQQMTFKELLDKRKGIYIKFMFPETKEELKKAEYLIDVIDKELKNVINKNR